MLKQTKKKIGTYVSPATSCLCVNYNICAGSGSGSAGIPAGYGGELIEENGTNSSEPPKYTTFSGSAGKTDN